MSEVNLIKKEIVKRITFGEGKENKIIINNVWTITSTINDMLKEIGSKYRVYDDSDEETVDIRVVYDSEDDSDE